VQLAIFEKCQTQQYDFNPNFKKQVLTTCHHKNIKYYHLQTLKCLTQFHKFHWFLEVIKNKLVLHFIQAAIIEARFSETFGF